MAGMRHTDLTTVVPDADVEMAGSNATLHRLSRLRDLQIVADVLLGNALRSSDIPTHTVIGKSTTPYNRITAHRIILSSKTL